MEKDMILRIQLRAVTLEIKKICDQFTKDLAEKTNIYKSIVDELDKLETDKLGVTSGQQKI